MLPRSVPWKRFDSVPFDGPQEKWELYDIRNDFSQGNDLAKAHPGKLEELQRLFDARHVETTSIR